MRLLEQAREWLRLRTIYLVLKWMQRYKVFMMTMDTMIDKDGTELIMIGIKHKGASVIHFDYFERISGKQRYTYTLTEKEVAEAIENNG